MACSSVDIVKAALTYSSVADMYESPGQVVACSSVALFMSRREVLTRLLVDIVDAGIIGLSGGRPARRDAEAGTDPAFVHRAGRYLLVRR